MFCGNIGFICLVLCMMTIEWNEAKPLKQNAENLNFKALKNIVKRGLSSSIGNDYGPPVLVSSDILQLEHSPPSKVGADSKTFGNLWQGSNLSPGYEVWLDSGSGLQNYQPIHHSFGDSGGTEHLGVFSTDQLGISEDHLSGHITHVPASSLDGHLSGVLHTQVISSGQEHTISGNLDFNNVADAKSHFPVTSYGR